MRLRQVSECASSPLAGGFVSWAEHYGRLSPSRHLHPKNRKGVKGAKSKSVFQHSNRDPSAPIRTRPWFDFCNNIIVVRRISPGSRLRADLHQMSASKPIGPKKDTALGDARQGVVTKTDSRERRTG
jgi:hypothetical protein